MKYKRKHPLFWFKVGKEITNNEVNLFTPPIRIEDEKHGKALHAEQDKGYRFKYVTG